MAYDPNDVYDRRYRGKHPTESEEAFRQRSWLGGVARAKFWKTQGHINLVRGNVVRWVMMRRHWPEECLGDFMADLSDRRIKK